MIVYRDGNLFENLVKDKKNIILHVCNDAGGWGSGFVLSVNKYCGTKPRTNYRKWFVESFYIKNNYQVPFKLGQIQVSETDDKNTFIINMIAQSTPRGCSFNICKETVHLPPFRPDSFRECMYRVVELCQDKDLNIVCPLIGCGLAGSTQDVVFGIVEEVVQDNLSINVWII